MPAIVEADEALVEMALAGDRRAFATLVDRYQGKLLRFLQARCRDRQDAEDALQEAFIDAWRYLDSFDARWRFSTWLYRIALRRAQKATARRQDDLEFLPAAAADPLAACVAGDALDNVWLTARRTLPADAVSALWLHYVEELPQRDVARALGRTLPWTKVTLMRARKRLKTAMAGDLPGDTEHEAYG